MTDIAPYDKKVIVTEMEWRTAMSRARANLGHHRDIYILLCYLESQRRHGRFSTYAMFHGHHKYQGSWCVMFSFVGYGVDEMQIIRMTHRRVERALWKAQDNYIAFQSAIHIIGGARAFLAAAGISEFVFKKRKESTAMT